MQPAAQHKENRIKLRNKMVKIIKLSNNSFNLLHTHTYKYIWMGEIFNVQKYLNEAYKKRNVEEWGKTIEVHKNGTLKQIFFGEDLSFFLKKLILYLKIPFFFKFPPFTFDILGHFNSYPFIIHTFKSIYVPLPAHDSIIYSIVAIFSVQHILYHFIGFILFCSVFLFVFTHSEN